MQSVEDAAVSWRSILLLIFLSLMWGSSYILIKKAILIYTPMQVGAMRLSISGLAFVPYLLWRWRRVDWSKSSWLLLVGVTGTGLPSLLFPLAQAHISSSVAGILNSLTPLFTLLIGILVFRAPFFWAKMVGVLLGLSGATLLVLAGSEGSLNGSSWYGLLIVLATMCYATSTNTVGYRLREMGSLTISAVSFAMVGIPSILLAVWLGVPQTMMSEPAAWTGLLYIAVLALGSTVLASVLFFQLIKMTGPVFSSMVSYLVPVIALGWGLLDSEYIGWIHFLGMALILSGVYLSRRRKSPVQSK